MLIDAEIGLVGWHPLLLLETQPDGHDLAPISGSVTFLPQMNPSMSEMAMFTTVAPFFHQITWTA
jgi:hypothetical protein